MLVILIVMVWQTQPEFKPLQALIHRPFKSMLLPLQLFLSPENSIDCPFKILSLRAEVQQPVEQPDTDLLATNNDTQNPQLILPRYIFMVHSSGDTLGVCVDMHIYMGFHQVT